MIIINNYEEMKKYYVKETNTYVFNDDVGFNFNLNIEANINAWDINALDINAHSITACDINANDIKAWNINANEIDYYSVCFAYKNIKCKSIKGVRENHKHFVLDGVLEVLENEY